MEHYQTPSIKGATGFKHAYVIGNSMAPLLQEGDLLFIKKKVCSR